MLSFKNYLLLEGGAAGHMAHPFDLKNVKTGNDLVKLFNAIENSVKRNKTAVKFDGLNASVKLIKNEAGNYQYAFDRGSAKPIDLKGITRDNVLERFEKGHGMIAVVNFLLPVLDSTIETTMQEINKLGLKKPNRFLNLEYVTGQTNVTHYDRNMIVIHGINEFVPHYAKNKRLLSRTSIEVPYSKEILNEHIVLKNKNPEIKELIFLPIGTPVKIQMNEMRNYILNINNNTVYPIVDYTLVPYDNFVQYISSTTSSNNAMDEPEEEDEDDEHEYQSVMMVPSSPTNPVVEPEISESELELKTPEENKEPEEQETPKEPEKEKQSTTTPPTENKSSFSPLDYFFPKKKPETPAPTSAPAPEQQTSLKQLLSSTPIPINANPGK